MKGTTNFECSIYYLCCSCSPELTPYFCYISILLWIHFANYPRLSTLLKVLLLLIISVLVIVSTNVADLCCDSLDYKLVRLPSNDTTTSEGGAENTVKVPIPVSVFSGETQSVSPLLASISCAPVWKISVQPDRTD